MNSPQILENCETMSEASMGSVLRDLGGGSAVYKQTLVNLPYGLTQLKVFGDESLPIDCMFPTLEQIKEFPEDEEVQLCKLNYKDNDSDNLYGIQLEFTSSIESPLFETFLG